MARLTAAVVAALLVVGAWAAPAGAHAELEATEPAAGAALDTPPSEIVLDFSEPVEVAVGGVRVYDGDANRLDRDHPRHPPGATDAVALSLPGLDDGVYVVTWRVTSADGHPVHGAFTFRVGDAGRATGGDTRALVEQLLAADGGDKAVGTVFAADRALVFASLLVLVGGVAFLVALWPAGLTDRRARRLVAGAWGTLAIATVAGIGLQGAYAGGLGLLDAVDPDVVSSVLDTRFGRVWAARLGLLVVAAPLLALSSRRRAVVPALALVGVALLVTPGLSGHASSGDLVAAAVVADTVHLAAVAVWVGGLTMLVAVVLRRPSGDDTGADGTASALVTRFSLVALAAVAVILASGLFQSWRQLREVDALTDTTYGRLLAVKVGVFAAMVAAAGFSRSWVRRRAAAVSPGPGAAAAGPSWRSLRRTVALEALGAVAVVVLTALLVNAVPGRIALAQPYSVELEAGDLLVDLTIDPARRGPVDVHLYTLSGDGLPAEVEDVTVSLRLDDEGIGPLEVPMQRAGPNHFAAYAFDLPIAGSWRLDVVVRTSDIAQEQATTTVPIR